MRLKKIKELEAKGFTVGDATSFLKLTEEDAALIDGRLKATEFILCPRHGILHLNTIKCPFNHDDNLSPQGFMAKELLMIERLKAKEAEMQENGRREKDDR